MNKFIRIFLSLFLACLTLWVVLAVGDATRIPVTPCFSIGVARNITPAKPCIDIIGWDTYQVSGLLLTIGLTWGWYALIKKYFRKAKK